MTSRMTFITIGYVEWRKGQDVLIDAILQLPVKLVKETEFILVGQNTSLMAQRLKDRLSAVKNVKFIGTVSREELIKYIEGADVMICPSREDPMPTVCAEAMMHKVPCIISNAAGTSEYIKDGYDGLVFANEDVDDLRKKIIWCMDNREVLHQMGEKAYAVYKRYFSMETFEKNLLKYVSEMI